MQLNLYFDLPSKNPYESQPNCFCDINPVTRLLELSQVEYLPYPPAVKTSDVNLHFVTEVETFKPIFVSKTTLIPTSIPSSTNPIVQADTPLKCAYFNNTEENERIDVDLVRKNIDALDFIKIPAVYWYELQNLEGTFKIYCYNFK